MISSHRCGAPTMHDAWRWPYGDMSGDWPDHVGPTIASFTISSDRRIAKVLPLHPLHVFIVRKDRDAFRSIAIFKANDHLQRHPCAPSLSADQCHEMADSGAVDTEGSELLNGLRFGRLQLRTSRAAKGRADHIVP